MGAVPKTLGVRRRQAEHDASIGDGLRRFLKSHDRPLVGIMGGHSVSRDDAAYRDLALLAGHFSDRGYLIVTGGGPGIMGAAHFGVAFSGRNTPKFDEALALLKGAARFPDLDGLLKDDGSIALDMENRQIESALRSGRPTDEDRDLEDKPSLGRPLGIGRVLFPRYRSAANQRDSDSS